MSPGVVIAGGGLAAQRCAETLRRSGYDGRIRMVCAEPHRPYDRPPLSKEVLLDEQSDDMLSFRAGEWYEEHAVELMLGVRACALEPSQEASEPLRRLADHLRPAPDCDGEPSTPHAHV